MDGSSSTAIQGAIDALRIASACGGELDRQMYSDACKALEQWQNSMGGPSPSGEALRVQALDLLCKAQSLDGLKPYSITHRHSEGEGVYLLWSKADPTLDDILAILGCKYEPERDESLRAEVVFSLEKLVGLSTDPGDVREQCLPIDTAG